MRYLRTHCVFVSCDERFKPSERLFIVFTLDTLISSRDIPLRTSHWHDIGPSNYSVKDKGYEVRDRCTSIGHREQSPPPNLVTS